MGKIDSKKLDNGTVALEITYGGDEVSFGGLDSSGPPMYISPGGFADENNFVIANKELVAISWKNLGITLSGWGSNKYLGAGKLRANRKYYNWVLGYTIGAPTGSPPSITANYSIWVFKGLPSTPVPLTATISVTQTQTTAPAGPAVGKIAVNPGYTDIKCPSWDTIYMSIGNAQYAFQYLCPGSAGPAPSTPTGLATYIGGPTGVINSNATTNGVSSPVTATVETDGLTIDLTTIATGTAANSTGLSISIYSPTNSSKGFGVNQHFAGGTDAAVNTLYGQPIDPLSWTSVGESLYFGGNGSYILTFSYPNEVPQFSVLTEYLGAVTLNKFNNQLIAGGIIPGPGQVIQAGEMVVGWSAPGIFSQWRPLDFTGKVTGAGFNQISDICDYISGLFIANNILVILRSFGVDYMNALQNAVIPFDFNHISNALIGEGCQDSRLANQYDQIGCFVGITNVFQYSGQLSPIGDAVKNTLIFDVMHDAIQRDSIIAPHLITHNINTFAHFLVDYKIYNYCFNSSTWSLMNMLPGNMHLDFFVAESSIPDYVQFQNNTLAILVTDGPTFWVPIDALQTVDFPLATAPFVVFKQEEIMFGRDITIDALLINVAGTPGQTINFSVSGILHGSITLTAPSDTTFAPYQCFFTEQVTTIKNPQLRIDIPLNASGVFNKVKFGKITMFGSFDPNQRPV